METILEDSALETQAAVQSVRQAYDGQIDQPKEAWVRGACPLCGCPVVSNCYYVGGHGYIIVWECWESLSSPAACTYHKVL